MTKSSLPSTWVVDRVVADVATLHGLGAPMPAQRMVRWCVATRPALVLGSAQPESDVDAERAKALGIDVVKRRSGGGAVLVEPETTLWVDVFVPVDDPLWQRDVGRAFWWLGDVWVKVLADAAGVDAVAHRGALQSTPWSRTVCFAGLGPGEVLIDDKKIVGVSQRRTRVGALFQCSLYRSFDASYMAAMFAKSPSERRSIANELQAHTAVLPLLDEDTLRNGLMRCLDQID